MIDLNRAINSVVNFVKSHLYLTLGATFVAVLLFFYVGGGIGASLAKWKANRFDAKQVAYEKQIGDLKVEREALIKRANDAEAKATLKEAEAKELKDLIAAKGGSIAASEKELERKLEEAKKGSGDCALDPNPHDCLCSKLKALGFECN